MNFGVLLAAVAWMFVCASPTPAREFGPEWTRVRAVPGGRVEFHKNVTVPVVNFGGGSNYRVPLDYGNMQVFEHNDNEGFAVDVGPYGRLAVHKNADGSIASHEVRFPGVGRPGVQYSDLDGDGVLDCMIDTRGTHYKSFIFMDDRFVPVKGPAVVGVTTVTAPDPHTEYLFENGKWRIKFQCYDLNGDGTVDAKEHFQSGLPIVWIMLDGKMIPVEGTRVSPTMTEAISTEGTKYKFESGKWRETSN